MIAIHFRRTLPIAAAMAWLWIAGPLRASEFQSTASPTVNHGPMNVLIIMTDEHNFRTLGCYRETMQGRQAYMWGPAVVDTPNIDSIAQLGALCTSFYATTPVCSPSRAAFLTGLYPQATPVVNNNIPLNDSMVTFAEILGQRGYSTGYAGKWHLDGAQRPQWAPQRKFGFADNRFMFNRGHWKKLEMTPAGPRIGAVDKQGVPGYAVADADETTFTTDFLADRSIEFIEQHKSEPFCYFVSFPDPHGPDTVRAPYDTMFQGQVFEKPTTYDLDERTIPMWGQPAPRAGFGQAAYYGMVKCIDDNVGRILDKLKREGLLERTLIVFTSDHGDLRGEHHRQNKGVAFEGSARVPFLIHCPGKVPAGLIVNQALTSVDFSPTLLSLLGIDGLQKVHGRDASSLFSSQPTADWNDIAFVRGTGDQQGWLMAVTDRFKLVVSSDDEPWLFDLVRDPDELINQRDNPGYRDTVSQLGTALLQYGRQFDDPRLKDARVLADVNWAASGQGTYSSQRIP